jgi:hypothetical protein
MQVIYVNEYQPSSATLKIGGDPIYKVSGDDEKIRVGKVAVPSPLLVAIPLLAIGGIIAVYWLSKRSE